MKHRVVSGAVVTVASLYPAGLLAHAGEHAHLHPADGPAAQLLHWLAGFVHWVGPVPLAAMVLAILVATLWRFRRRGPVRRRD